MSTNSKRWLSRLSVIVIALWNLALTEERGIKLALSMYRPTDRPTNCILYPLLFWTYHLDNSSKLSATKRKFVMEAREICIAASVWGRDTVARDLTRLPVPCTRSADGHERGYCSLVADLSCLWLVTIHPGVRQECRCVRLIPRDPIKSPKHCSVFLPHGTLHAYLTLSCLV